MAGIATAGQRPASEKRSPEPCLKKISIFVSKPLTMSTKERLQESLLVDQKEKDLNEIVLFNDDVNTFDHVIQTLVDVCEHTPEQAEQCSLIVHYNGKCTVKTGEYNDLKPRCTRLLQAGLNAEIV
jgi:ATP-dependent Clp protease adaptor protein ClpS